MEMVLVPAGSFDMGSPPAEEGREDDEGPVHRVTIARPFYVGKYEVTQRQWTAVMGFNPSLMQNPLVTAPDSPDDLPVEEVTWVAAREFVRRLNQRVPGGGFSLPTEAQWEYAARAGTETPFSFGDDSSRLGEYAWYEDNSLRRPHPVGRKKPNAWGLYDVHGNVWEWCSDGFAYYRPGPETDPQNPERGTAVLRGGAWEDPPDRCRSAYRLYTHIHDSGDGTGLRVVRAVGGEKGGRR